MIGKGIQDGFYEQTKDNKVFSRLKAFSRFLV